MKIRPPSPDDARDILAIARESCLPAEWTWPPGVHGLVADEGSRVVAFAILAQTVWGLVVEELWEEQSRIGFEGLGLLRREIERIAQRLATERGVPLSCGGVVRNDRERHIAALRKRGYSEEAVVLAKVFRPHPESCYMGE